MPRAKRSGPFGGGTTLHSCRMGNETVTIPTVASFIIIGAQKAGTTALGKYLNQHPNIVRSKKPNELHFFDFVFPNANDREQFASEDEYYCYARKRYAELFFPSNTLIEAVMNGTRNIMTFDKTPSYIHVKEGPHRVRKTCNWPTKIIAILRNPVDRAYSQYSMNLWKKKKNWQSFEVHINDELQHMRNIGLTDSPSIPLAGQENQTEGTAWPTNLTTKSLDDKLLESFDTLKWKTTPFVRKGMYASQLRHWIEEFPHPEDLLVLNYDDLERDTKLVYRRLLKHVGLPYHDPPEGFTRAFAGKYEPMANETRKFLERFFEPYNRELAPLLGDEWRDVWGA